jgi:hypothetical protein
MRRFSRRVESCRLPIFPDNQYGRQTANFGGGCSRRDGTGARTGIAGIAASSALNVGTW